MPTPEIPNKVNNTSFTNYQLPFIALAHRQDTRGVEWLGATFAQNMCRIRGFTITDLVESLKFW